MDPDADIEPDLIHSLDERYRAPDGSRGPVKGDKEPITGSIDLSSSETLELAPDDRIEALEQVSPSPVPEICSALRRVNDAARGTKSAEYRYWEVGVLSNPSLTATAAASVRVSTPSLPRMCET